MAATVFRPSIKGIIVWYILSSLLLVGVIFFLYTRQFQPRELWALIAIPLAIDVWASMKHIRINSRRLILDDGVLRFEDGLMSKKQRSLMLNKVRDVRIEQTFGQRIAGVGDLTVEALGEGSAMELENVDRPRQAADQILAAVKNSPTGR